MIPDTQLSHVEDKKFIGGFWLPMYRACRAMMYRACREVMYLVEKI
jgi:hypothetical protein